MKKHTIKRKPSILLVVMALMASILGMDAVWAHGERNQEPFLRMRTLHWYDVNFSVPQGDTLQVNELLTITGKFRIFSKWPKQIPEPERMYLNVNANGATFTKVESWVNGESAVQSFEGETGRDYEFKLVLKARYPGEWHVHPMVNVKDAGGLAGPGQTLNIAGNLNDFVQSGVTLDGTVIENLDEYGLSRVFGWHALWGVLAVVWLLVWISRPVLIPRYLMVKKGGYEDKLVTPGDKKLAILLLVIVFVLTVGGGVIANKQYPQTVTLQGGLATVPPMPKLTEIKTHMIRGEYFIPGRTVIAKLEVTNTAERPIQLGEFTSASLRFLNYSVYDAKIEEADRNFPGELFAKSGLMVDDNNPIQPGETKTIIIEATDAAWEVERLDSLLHDPESTLGAFLFFYDDEGNRYTSEMFGNALPIFDRARSGIVGTNKI